MKIHSISELMRKDVPLYYRNEYEALGDFELAMGNRMQIPLMFSIEIMPNGERIIDVKLKDRIDYPLIPVIRALKEKILGLERDGKLQ